ncbi:hypothetical protein Bpla01_09320 [Burkholderia plantarii]|nr:hypothetical protein Bpla01_09320 [Burkholderia plantarii]
MRAARTPALAKPPALLKRPREHLERLLDDKRPDRKCDRAVKSRPVRYAVRFLKKNLN